MTSPQSTPTTPTLEEATALIREIRPDLAGDDITPTTRLVDDLGLDSLDLVQIARRIRRGHGLELDTDGWAHTGRTLESLPHHLTPAAP